MNGADWITHLGSRGVYHFTTDEAVSALGCSVLAARASLRRLKAKGAIASPHRGFHVIVPPEYRVLGCLPAAQFIPQLMAHLNQPYYAALLSAGSYHGASHQQPMVFQVMVAKNRRPIECGKVRVQFVARRNVEEMPVVKLTTDMGYIAVSSPEATAYDLAGYPNHAGGLSNVATVLRELAESMTGERLADLSRLSPRSWSQRLGYLLDRIGAVELAESLAGRCVDHNMPPTALVPAKPYDRHVLDTRWNLYVNDIVEPDI